MKIEYNLHTKFLRTPLGPKLVLKWVCYYKSVTIKPLANMATGEGYKLKGRLVTGALCVGPFMLPIPVHIEHPTLCSLIERCLSPTSLPSHWNSAIQETFLSGLYMSGLYV